MPGTRATVSEARDSSSHLIRRVEVLLSTELMFVRAWMDGWTDGSVWTLNKEIIIIQCGKSCNRGRCLSWSIFTPITEHHSLVIYKEQKFIDSQSWRPGKSEIEGPHLVRAVLLSHNMAEDFIWVREGWTHFYNKPTLKLMNPLL